MKGRIALTILLPITVWANDWSKHSVSELLDSYLVAKASPSYVLDPKLVKDRPYTIQVAAHINERDAIQHVEQLKLQEDEVFYYPNFVKSQVFFKVCVGRFHTKEDAENYRKDFMKRMEEPFAVAIALGDQPGEDKVATKAQMASAKASKGRSIASVDSAPIDLKAENRGQSTTTKQEETEKQTAPAQNAGSKTEMNVQLMSKKTASATPMAASQSANGKLYALQVAAHATEAAAKVEVEKLKGLGQESFYRPAEVNGKTWYRVFVGKFTKYSEAEAFQDVYREQKPSQTIIRKVVN